jgi:hypothetical protein
MTAGLGLLVALELAAPAASARTCACPCPEGPEDAHPFRRPLATAFQLNREGRELYRTRQWAAARARYRAALEADPAFLGPRLNLACAHAQEGRFAEAVEEAADLARLAFVPWAEEIRQAADLAPLAAQPEMKRLTEALASAGRAWGEGLAAAVLFVARRGPPVRLSGSGVLHLGLEQEIVAWLPATGAYRQVTAEDGRVLAFVRSEDGRTVDYIRAGRLVREPGRPDRLRALTIRRLDLPTMVLGAPVPLGADLEEVQLRPLPSGKTTLRMRSGMGTSEVVFDGRFLSPVAAARRPRRGGVHLSARGIERPAAERQSQPCRFRAADVFESARPPAVSIRAPGRSFLLEAAFGAGLRGLPFP